MLQIALFGWILVVITVVIHALGFTLVLRLMFKARAHIRLGFLQDMLIMVVLTCFLLLIHMAEMVVWALFYWWQGCVSDFGTAMYFSAETYTTLGYGDIILPRPWRILAPMEALTGILMCGLSTGLFFGLVSRWISQRMESLKSSKHGK